MSEVIPSSSVITLYINRLSSAIKKQVGKINFKMLFIRDTYQIQRQDKSKMKGWKKIFYTNSNQKKAGVAILVSNKIDLKNKVIRDNERHYILTKGSRQQENITITDIYAPNNRMWNNWNPVHCCWECKIV